MIVSRDLALFAFLQEDEALLSECYLLNLDPSAPFGLNLVQGIVQCPLDVDVCLGVVHGLRARLVG